MGDGVGNRPPLGAGSRFSDSPTLVIHVLVTCILVVRIVVHVRILILVLSFGAIVSTLVGVFSDDVTSPAVVVTGAAPNLCTYS